MYEFTLPIELQREEHLDRVVEIVHAVAVGDEGPVCARFMGVPMVACPGQREVYTRECWQKLFDQFQADAELPQEQNLIAPEPETPVKRWYHTLRGKVLIAFPAAVLIILVIIGALTVYDAAEGADSVVTYDQSNGSITVNVDEWKKQVGCEGEYTMETSSYAIGSAQGNKTVKFTPYCVPLWRDAPDAHVAPDAHDQN